MVTSDGWALWSLQPVWGVETFGEAVQGPEGGGPDMPTLGGSGSSAWGLGCN